MKKSFCLRGHHLISFSQQNIENRLCSHDLAYRRDQRRLSEVFSYSRNFFHDLVKSVHHLLLLKLKHQIGQHASRDLIFKYLIVDRKSLGIHPSFLYEAIHQLSKVIRYICNKVLIQPGVSFRALIHLSYSFCRGLACSHGKRRYSRIYGVTSGVYGFHISHRRYAAGAMAVKVHGNLYILLSGPYQLLCGIGRQYPCHVLYTDGIGSHALHFGHKFHPVIEGIAFPRRICRSHLDFSSFCLGGFYTDLQVSQIIEGVEYTYYIYAL